MTDHDAKPSRRSPKHGTSRNRAPGRKTAPPPAPPPAQAETDVVASQDRLHCVLEHSLDVIYRRNLQTDRYDCVSPSVEKLTGYTPAEFTSDGLRATVDRVHPDDLADALRAIDDVMTNASGRGLAEYRYRRKDGAYRWFADHYTVTRDAAGKPLYWVGVVRDVTELREAREQLQRSRDEMESQVRQRTAELQTALDKLQKREELFHRMATTINQVFWIEDTQTDEVLYVSPAYETIWGRTCESARADVNSWQQAIHPDDRERVIAAVVAMHRQGNYEDQEYRIVRPDGTVRWVRDRGVPVRDAAGNISLIVGCSDDITERKRLEREILEIGDREQRRIGQDLHDGLCQLLVGASLLCNAIEQQLARTNHPETEKTHRLDQLLTEAVVQMRAVARGLNPVGIEQDGLRVALRLLARNVTSLFGTPCTFSEPQPVTVNSADAALHLYRIAQEAVTNAVKHAHPRNVAIELRSHQDRVTVRIEDDGAGFAENHATDRGMGIHIMQHRASMVGATFSISPRPGGGTTVLCSWPSPQTITEEAPTL